MRSLFTLLSFYSLDQFLVRRILTKSILEKLALPTLWEALLLGLPKNTIEFDISPTKEIIQDSYDPNREGRPRVVLSHPHGTYCLALKAFTCWTGNRNDASAGNGDLPKKNPLRKSRKRYCFVDAMLQKISPSVILSAKILGWDECLPLENKTVERVMKSSGVDLQVMAGGFVECATSSSEEMRIYTETWPYWVKACITHGYDLEIQMIDGGHLIFPQNSLSMFNSKWFDPTAARASLAKKSIPTMFHSPIPQKPGGNGGKPMKVASVLMKYDSMMALADSEGKKLNAKPDAHVDAVSQEILRQAKITVAKHFTDSQFPPVTFHRNAGSKKNRMTAIEEVKYEETKPVAELSKL